MNKYRITGVKCVYFESVKNVYLSKITSRVNILPNKKAA